MHVQRMSPAIILSLECQHSQGSSEGGIRPKAANKSNQPLPHYLYPTTRTYRQATTPDLPPKAVTFPLTPPLTHSRTKVLEPCEIMRYDLLVVGYVCYVLVPRLSLDGCLYVVCCMLYVVCCMLYDRFE